MKTNKVERRAEQKKQKEYLHGRLVWPSSKLGSYRQKAEMNASAIDKAINEVHMEELVAKNKKARKS